MIAFAPAVTGTRANPTVLTLAGTQLELTAGVTIAGPGADLLQINGGWNGSATTASGSGIFQVDAGTTVAISGLTLTRGDGHASSSGGAISTISNSTATSGGGVVLLGNATLTSMAVLNKTAANIGGGVYAGGTRSVVHSLVFGNTAANQGGGFNYNHSDPPFTLTQQHSHAELRNDGGALYTNV